MDLLKAEIERKRKADSLSSSSAPSVSGAATKYVRRGELERRREEEYRREQEEKQRRREEKERKEREEKERGWKKGRDRASATPEILSEDSSRGGTPTVAAAIIDNLSGAGTTKEAFNISNEEAIRRLRAKGQPIRLFAESDKERRLRLRALELIEEKGGGREGQNDFMRALGDMESGMDLEEIERRAQTSAAGAGTARKTTEDKKKGKEEAGGADGTDVNATGQEEEDGMGPPLDLDLLRKDPNKLYPKIYYMLKDLLKEWEESMAQRPDHLKRSTQGKLAAATQVQTAEYLKPFFKALRKRDLEPDVLGRISEIVHHMQKREYQKANDAYLRLSIGNSPWPIGVTMVGIHERSGREKIFSSNVAHVLNDEVSRKYIQSLKRLMTFAQTRYPPWERSQLMG